MKTIGGLLGAIFVAVVSWWLTEGLRRPTPPVAPLPVPTSPSTPSATNTPATIGSPSQGTNANQVRNDPARQVQYKLIWYNHYEKNKLYEVLRTDPSRKEVGNNDFKQWCTPFDPNAWIVYESREIAGDEHWKEDGDRLTRPPFNLPRMNERWFQIMDDEKWYFYAVKQK